MTKEWLGDGPVRPAGVFERIVVGVDRSSAAGACLAWAARLAGPGLEAIVAVHAAGLLAEPDDRSLAGQEVWTRLDRVVADGWDAPPRRAGCDVRAVVRGGVPADVLRQVAVDEAADLVILGTRGAGTAAAGALGSTSLRFLQLAPCPVLIVPDSAGPRREIRLREIVMAVDGATPIAAVADLVARLATIDGAQVTIVHALDQAPVFALGPAATAEPREVDDPVGRNRARLAPLVCRFRQGGLAGTLRIEDGPVVEVVTAIASSGDADLVVVGSAHPSHSPDPLYESTSRRIAALLGHIRQAVLVVPETTT